MRIREALNVQRGDIVAFTGAGGKTSALMRLGRELADEGWRVIATTTTRIAASELTLARGELSIGGPRGSYRPSAISRALTQNGFVFVYHEVRNGKAIGVAPEVVEALTDSVDSDVILIEADGSRRLPFKAPYANEPVIPIGTTLVVPVTGFNAIGVPLDDEHVYNPEAMIERYGYAPEGRVRGPWIASVMRDPELGLKGVPQSARIVGLLNQVRGGSYQRSRARLLARMILQEPRINAVAFGCVQDEQPILELQRRVGAIVLAGGLSSRMGKSKVLPWDGRPIIQVIVDRLKRMRLDDIVVVTGHLAPQVKAAIGNEPARIAFNEDYRSGEMLSSLQTGLRALGPEFSAAMIVLGDQPQLDNRIVGELLSAYAEGKGRIVAPSYRQHRGHPILIDRSLWSEILDLPAGRAPRDVINAHAADTYYVNVSTDSILRDIDTPDDYQQERRRAGL